MGELIDVVDDEENIISSIQRSTVRKNALLHRVSVIIIMGKNGHFLVQKRSASKDIFPSCWEIGCAETIKSGESYEDAAVRGLKEELGIEVSQTDIKGCLQFRHKYRSDIHNVNYNVYIWSADEFFTLQKEEIEEAKFLGKDEVIKMMKENPFGPVSAEIFQKYLQIQDPAKH